MVKHIQTLCMHLHLQWKVFNKKNETPYIGTVHIEKSKKVDG